MSSPVIAKRADIRFEKTTRIVVVDEDELLKMMKSEIEPYCCKKAFV